MISPSTCPCSAPATRAGYCEACIEKERAWRLPFARMACDALEELGYLDMVVEVRRRMGVFSKLPFEVELERLTDE